MPAVNDRVHRVQAPYPGNAVLLYQVRGEKLALIDSGAADSPAAAVEPALRELGLGWPDLDYLINTHGHKDHAGGNGVVKEARLGRRSRRTAPTRVGFRAGDSCGQPGMYVPFAKTEAERIASGDPRLSLEERYSSHDGYVDRVRTATLEMVSTRQILQQDADRIIAAAEARDVLK